MCYDIGGLEKFNLLILRILLPLGRTIAGIYEEVSSEGQPSEGLAVRDITNSTSFCSWTSNMLVTTGSLKNT